MGQTNGSGRFRLRAALGVVAALGTAAAVGCVGSMAPGADAEPMGTPLAPMSGKPNPSTPASPSSPTTTPGIPPSVSTPTPVSCDASATPAAPARLWRLNERQYARTVATLLGGRSRDANRDLTVPAGVAFPFGVVNENDRFSTRATSYKVDELSFRTALNAGERVAALLVQGLASSCLGGTMAFAPCMESLVADKGALAFRRPLTREEIADYVALAVRFEPTMGRQAAAQHAFHAMLMAPPFLFRTELGELRAGKLQLGSHELAAALSYTLTDGPPDEALWRDAVSGAINDRAAIERHVARLLGTSLQTEPMFRFLREYFRYDATTELTKAEKFHNARALVDDTDAFMRTMLAEAGRRDFLKTLLTTSTVFASKTSLTNYGLRSLSTPPERLQDPQRLGVLTHPAWLTSFSQTDANDPIRRGRFIHESLLCGHVPEIDIEEIPPIPADPTRTLRENLAVHTKNGTCNGCHMLMDPMGLAFEGFDHYGRLRTSDTGKPVDTSGALVGSGDQDGSFKDLREMITRLTSSRKVTECFAAHAFEAWLGRAATAADGCTVKRAAAAYDTAGGDLSALMVALFTSDSFLVRKL